MKILVAQLGARQDYTVPLAIQELGVLKRFYTDLFINSHELKIINFAKRLTGNFSMLDNFLSRYNSSIKFEHVTRFLGLGLRYKHALQRAKSTEAVYKAYIDFGKEFNSLILRCGMPDASHIYGFDHAAFQLFQTAKSRHTTCILDQIYAGPAHEYLAVEEEELSTEWFTSSFVDFYRSAAFREWCDIQLAEWQLADKIIVASQYTKQAIISVCPSASDKIVKVPLTVELASYRPYQRIRHYKRERPLRVLYVGRINTLKGVHYLLQAFAKIPASVATLNLIGDIQFPIEKMVAYQDIVTFCGPKPHHQIPVHYQEADLLVFPTISDGFGAVMLEAMMTGLPVIATHNCGDIVEDGRNGYRVPIRDIDAIVEKIFYLHKHPEVLSSLSEGAIDTCQKYSFDHYSFQLSKALNILGHDRAF